MVQYAKSVPAFIATLRKDLFVFAPFSQAISPMRVQECETIAPPGIFISSTPLVCNAVKKLKLEIPSAWLDLASLASSP